MTDGKFTPKPSDTFRKKLAKRAKDQTKLIQEMNAEGKPTTLGILIINTN